MRKLVMLSLGFLVVSSPLCAGEVKMSYSHPGYSCESYTTTTFNNLCKTEKSCLALFTCSYGPNDFLAQSLVSGEPFEEGLATRFNKSQHFWRQAPGKPPLLPSYPVSDALVYLEDWLWCKLGVAPDDFGTKLMSQVKASCVPMMKDAQGIRDLDMVSQTEPIVRSDFADPISKTSKPAVLPILLGKDPIVIDEPLRIGDAGYNGVVLLAADSAGKQPLLTKPFQEIIWMAGTAPSEAGGINTTTITPSAAFLQNYPDSCAIIIQSAHPVVIQDVSLQGFKLGICIERKTEVVLSHVSIMGGSYGLSMTDASGTMITDAAGNPKGIVPADTANPNKGTWVLLVDSLISGSQAAVKGDNNSPASVVTYNSVISGKSMFTGSNQNMVVIGKSLSDSWAKTAGVSGKAPQLQITKVSDSLIDAKLVFSEPIAGDMFTQYSAIVYFQKEDAGSFQLAQLLSGTSVKRNDNTVIVNGINTKDVPPDAMIRIAVVLGALPNGGRGAAAQLFKDLQTNTFYKIPTISDAAPVSPIIVWGSVFNMTGIFNMQLQPPPASGEKTPVGGGSMPPADSKGTTPAGTASGKTDVGNVPSPPSPGQGSAGTGTASAGGGTVSGGAGNNASPNQEVNGVKKPLPGDTQRNDNQSTFVDAGGCSLLR